MKTKKIQKSEETPRDKRERQSKGKKGPSAQTFFVVLKRQE